MVKIKKLRIGQPLYKYYAMWRVEAIGYDWVVVRSVNPHADTFPELLDAEELSYFTLENPESDDD